MAVFCFACLLVYFKAILTNIKKYTIEVFTCVFLVSNSCEHLFIKLVAISVPLMEKCLLFSFAEF